MPWEEFKQLLAGLGPETPLGRIVSIRMEEDENVLNHFSKEQRRIRNEWLQRRAQSTTSGQTEEFIEQMKQAFIQMAGGGKN